MRSKFDSPLDVTNGDVSARGTFEWAEDEEKAVVEVILLQEWGAGKLAKAGTGKAVFMRSATGDKWSLTVHSGASPNQLVPSKKTLATGVACALGKEIEMRQFIWTEEIELD